MIAVGVIGQGAIGQTVAAALSERQVEGCGLAGTYAPSGRGVKPVASVASLVAMSDLVVEAAGHAALVEHGPAVRAHGRDLLVVSAGALADDALRQRLLGPGGGRVLISSGAVGGLDILRAAALHGGLEVVELTTTKPSRVLIDDTTPPDLEAALRTGTEAVTAFRGSAREAVARFPQSVNVAATLALATIGFDRTRVTVIGDPDADGVEHLIAAQGQAGEYRFRFRNRPSPRNPRTSAVTPYAVLRALADRTQRVVIGA